MGTLMLWIPVGEWGRSSDWVVARDIGGRVSYSVKELFWFHWKDRSDGWFNDRKSVGDGWRGENRDRWHCYSNGRDRRGRNKVWEIRARHNYKVSEGGNGHGRRGRTKGERQWGVTFIIVQGRLCIFEIPFWDLGVIFSQVSFPSDQEGPSGGYLYDIRSNRFHILLPLR